MCRSYELAEELKGETVHELFKKRRSCQCLFVKKTISQIDEHLAVGIFEVQTCVQVDVLMSMVEKNGYHGGSRDGLILGDA